MTMPIGIHSAIEATRDLAHSALPDAPVLPEPPTPARTRARLRLQTALAVALRATAGGAGRAAARIEPCRGVTAH